jgi:hypothetical protein
VAQPVILAIQEAAIRRITAQSQQANNFQNPISKKPTKGGGGAGEVAQDVGPEFKF